MGTLEALRFDNLALRALPVDSEEGSRIREVRGACYARVKPTPLERPRLVAASPSALSLLDLAPSEAERPEFVAAMAGNALLPDSDPAGHVYCGHQFGNFAGQLGDGAVIYLGEVVNGAGARWEVQLKGAGLTPFSRSADGRKVLRSSLREFLASEAMHHLGIATTRAGCVVTSDSRVVRDPLYSGDPVAERCCTVLRLAPTFLRFGSFEIFKLADKQTGRVGPSHGLEDKMLPVMLDHTIRTFFPDIWHARMGDSLQKTEDKEDIYLDFFQEVVRRTAQLVAAWQCVGFCHGVLNTDNMSILGLTIDYGPYGFLDRYDPEHVCNHSDDGGRYAFAAQPGVCRWNCEKLAEALAPVLPLSRARSELAMFDQEFDRCYMRVMRRKLGLVELEDADSDRALIYDLLQVMQDSGADFINTFRWLAHFPMPAASSGAGPAAQQNGATANGKASADLAERTSNGALPSGTGGEDGGFLDRLLASLPPPAELAQSARPRMPAQTLRVLLQFMHNDLLLASMGISKEMLQEELRTMQRAEEISNTDPAEKARADRVRWGAWLGRYRTRLQQEADAGASPRTRVDLMNATNPRYVLRNWMAQHAIAAAEKGDFSEVRRVLRLLEQPFSDDVAAELDTDGQDTGVCSRTVLAYDGPVPVGAKGLCVSCSS